MSSRAARFVARKGMWLIFVALAALLIVLFLTGPSHSNPPLTPGLSLYRPARPHGAAETAEAVVAAIVIAALFTWFVIGGLRGVVRWIRGPHPRARQAPALAGQLRREMAEHRELRRNEEDPPGSWDPGSPVG
jgi:hypothetical protein